MVNPASRQMSTNLVASSTPFVPHALKNSFPPPNVPVPKVRTGTLKPEPPKNLYSIRGIYRFLRGLQACDRLRSQAQAFRDIQLSGLRLSPGCENGPVVQHAPTASLPLGRTCCETVLPFFKMAIEYRNNVSCRKN